MTPATIIREAQADGVRLALSPTGTIKATGDGVAVNRWLAVIRESKAEIIEALKVSAGDTAPASSWCWWLAFSETEHMIVYFHPEATRAEVLERYPGVLVAEPYTPPETTADVLPTDMDRTAADPYPHWPEAAH